MQSLLHAYNPLLHKVNDKTDVVSEEALSQHVGADKAQWADATKSYWSCIDGRETEPVFGTPGGDYSELLMGLAVLEKNAGITLTEEQVNDLFSSWLDTISAERKFYMHTDDHCVPHLLEAVGLPKDSDVRQIPADKVDAALEVVDQPQNIGCGHIKFALIHASDYGLSADLPKFLIRAFYKRLWSGDAEKLHLAVVKGPHEEKAVVMVKEAQTPASESAAFAPKLSPTFTESGAVSVFMAHPGFVHSGIRRPVASFVVKQLEERFAGASDVNESAVVAQLDELANVQLGQTVPRLAGHMPIYELSVKLN
eukprot:TRINITY_DN878_c3_g1_i1.p2 TRINITY_DN878_c3_g1~~TRINITY_DN878_c3_g1_i1.p2  ORF type:complete len:310 (-),score=52.14 TRINITY_DN878_c3_g1_i1:64-993(-)